MHATPTPAPAPSDDASLVGWRRWVFPLMAVVVLPALLLAAVEGTLRLADYGFDPRFFVPAADDPGTVVSNPRFGHLFFPPAVARRPLPTRLSRDKPDGPYRLFVLGGSAALGTPDAAFSFGRILEVMLRESFPERRFELINGAMTAVNSHVMRRVAQEASDLDPDAFLIYLGNNEVVGPYGPGTLFGVFREGLGWTRASIALKGTRLGQVVGRIATADGPGDLRRWRGMEMFEEHRVEADDPRLPAVYEHFRANLEAMADAARDAGAVTLLSTVAVNLRDQPPFAGDQAEDLYRRGLTALERGKEIEADELLRRALDADALRFRADSGLQRVIREVAAARADVLPVDGAAAVGPLGDGFWEHVHLDFDGNYRLARAFYDALAPRLSGPAPPPAPSRELCAQRLAYSPWDEARSAEEIFRMIRRPPFTGSFDHQARVESFRTRLAGLRQAAHHDRAVAEALDRRAVAGQPEDPLLRAQLAEILTELGRPADAAAIWQGLVGRFPDADDWRTALGFALADAGRPEAAEVELRRVLDRADGTQEAAARTHLASLLAESGRPEAAEEAFRAALAKNPSHEPARAGLARLLETTDRGEEAVALLETGLAAAPDSPALAVALAETLDRRGRLPAAVESYRRALELDPELVAARNNLGYALERLGRTEEAAMAYRGALERDPTFALAHFNLADAALARGDADAAARHYRAGLAFDATNRQARANLALALRAAGG